MSTFIIAEAGVNHNGSESLALDLVDVAAAAGADAVKFQTFDPDSLVSAHVPMAAYQQRNLGAPQSQADMLRGLVLPVDAYRRVAERCRERGIEFMSTAFDESSLAFLLDELHPAHLKIASGDLLHAPLLRAAARSGLPVFVSTGMASLGDVEDALGVLAHALDPEAPAPSRAAFAAAWASAECRARLRDRVTLLHCVSEYPAQPNVINLRAMDTLATATGLSVGYSDHTLGISVPVAAVARGAVVLEKHFTLDRRLRGPDHAASLEPAELTALVSAVREVEAALGTGVKVPVAEELATRSLARRSLVAARPIAAGRTLEPADLAVKRPGTGRSPLEYWEVLGTTVSRGYDADEVL